MSTVLQREGRPRWSVGVFIVLTLSLLGLALTHSSAALGTTDSATTTDLELGDNDFRISDMGPDGDMSASARLPKVAYNSTNNEYLVVWAGQDEPNGPFDIYAQRIDATTGAEIGENDFRVSQTGDEDNQLAIDSSLAVAYNSTANEYLVVWEAEISRAPDFPIIGIFGQRLNAETGAAVGTDDFRVDQDSEPREWDYSASHPAVTYNSTDDEYLVVWRSNLAEDRSFEIVGQRLNSVGSRVGTNEFFISDMGPEKEGEEESFDSRDPDVAYNVTDNEYMVVWAGDDNIPPLIDNDFEVFGQRLTATGSEIGANDFRISTRGSGADGLAIAHPTVVYNSAAGEYLVVWSSGFDRDFMLLFEIYVQRLGTDGTEQGGDSRISDRLEVSRFKANYPGVVYNPIDSEYIVSWSLDSDFEDSRIESEVYGQRLDGTSASEIGENDFRISDMGSAEDLNYKSFDTAIAYNSRDNEYLVVWSGDDDTDPLVNNEREIFGQRLTGQLEATPTPTPTDPAATATPTATPTTTPPSMTPTPTPTPGVPPVDSSRTFLPLIIR